MLAHVLEREQALALDRLDDLALAHAVAAADFRVVGHRLRAVVAFVAGVAEVRLAEHELVANLGNVLRIAQQLEVPAAIDGVAIEARTDDAVVLQHQPLVDAADRIGERDGLGVLAAHELAGREQIDAGYLELRRGHRTGVAADAQIREVVRGHFRHVEQRRDEPVARARGATRIRRPRRCADRTSASCR